MALGCYLRRRSTHVFCRYKPNHGGIEGCTHHRTGSRYQIVGSVGICLQSFLGDQLVHPGTYKAIGLLKEANGVRAQL